MEKSMMLEIIGDSMENRMLDFLIEGIGIDYTKKDISDGCEISRPTLYKIFPRMLKEKLIKPTRTVGKVQLYSLNIENEKIMALLKLEEFLLKRSFEDVEHKIKIKIL